LDDLAMHYRIFILLGLLILISAGFAAAGQGPREPSIDGKRLSVWLDKYQKSIPKPEYDGDPQMRARAEEAIRKIGTNAMPWLLAELSAKEATRADELPTNFYSGEAIGRRWLATTAFEVLGPSARDATPTLIPLLDDKQTSYTAATALGGIGVESIPVLTKALTNTHACARESAARVLGLFGAKAQGAVPALVRCTKDEDESVRSFAAFALKQVDPEAAAKAGVK
jgi:HEAT repeat protein